MAANFGVNIRVSAEAARPIKVQANTPIGIVGYEASLPVGFHFFMSTSKAISAIETALALANQTANPKLEKGSIFRALKAIEDQAVETQIILNVFAKDAVEATNITRCKGGIEELKKAEAITGYRPNLIIAPEFSGEDAIKGALESTATRLKATGIVDIKAASSADAIAKMSAFGTNRLIASFPDVKVWDEKTNGYVYAGQSARIAGMIASVDGAWEYGFSDSYSNRVMNGVFGTKGDIEFALGENCEADELRNAHISTVIRSSGFRAWGGETSDQDSIWQDLARVRVFDRISEACQKGVFFAIDKRADQLYHAKRSVEELLRGFVGAKVLLGFEVSWSERNTQANITAGKFYLDVRLQNNPIVKQLTLDFIYVDNYGGVLMDTLKK